MGFTGSNIVDITKVRQSDVFLDVQQTVVGTVTVPQSILDADDALPLATLLTSTDGGATWNSLTTPIYAVVDAPYALDAEVYHEGNTYKSTVANNTTVPGVGDWTNLGAWDANGLLYNDLIESKKTTVVITGSVKQKYLVGNDSFLQVALFKNKIIAK